MKRSAVTRAGGIGVVLIIVLAIFFGVYVFLPSFTFYPVGPSTGVKMIACIYDTNSNSVCTNSFSTPVGLSIVNIGGSSVLKIGIPKTFVLLNYTGLPSSGTFTATEIVTYAKGVSDSYPISASVPSAVPVGAGACPVSRCPLSKNFSLPLPVSSWSASLLQSKWGQSYGQRVVNVTIVNSVIKLLFPSGISLPAKPSAFNFVAQFKLNYLAPITSTTTSTVTSTTSSSSTSIISTSTTSTVTTISVTTSATTSTTVNGGTISTGTVNVWPIVTTQITGGKTGTAAPSGVLVAVQPGSQTAVTVFLPPSVIPPQCKVAPGCALSIALLTPSISVTESNLPGTIGGDAQGNTIGYWLTWAFLASTSQGDTVVVMVNLGSAQIFNQAVTVDGSTTNITYTDTQGRTVTTSVLTAIAPQYQAWVTSYVAYVNAQTAAANATSTDPCNHYGPVYNRANCQASLMSVLSVSF